MKQPGNSESPNAAETGPERPRQIFYVRLDPPQPIAGSHLPGSNGNGKPPVRKPPGAESTHPTSSATDSPPGTHSSSDGLPTDGDTLAPSLIEKLPADSQPLSPSSTAPLPLVPATSAPASPVAESPVPPSCTESSCAPSIRNAAGRAEVTRSGTSQSDAARADSVEENSASLSDGVERVRRQARQLAAHLRARRQAVNRRREEAAEQHARDQAELARRITVIQQREEELDRQQEFVDQLKAEATAQHQEALETRLASEQLWAKMADRAEMPAILERVADLKRRLTDQYRNTLTVLARQQDALRRSADQLDRRQAELRKQRDELQAWVLRRHEELEQQRLQLIAREQELDAQERARQEIHSRVEEEILGYQRQIRQLSAQLRCKQELGRLRDSA